MKDSFIISCDKCNYYSEHKSLGRANDAAGTHFRTKDHEGIRLYRKRGVDIKYYMTLKWFYEEDLENQGLK